MVAQSTCQWEREDAITQGISRVMRMRGPRFNSGISSPPDALCARSTARQVAPRGPPPGPSDFGRFRASSSCHSGRSRPGDPLVHFSQYRSAFFLTPRRIGRTGWILEVGLLPLRGKSLGNLPRRLCEMQFPVVRRERIGTGHVTGCQEQGDVQLRPGEFRLPVNRPALKRTGTQ